MYRIRELAELSVGRACGFALIGIVTVIIGSSADMSFALAIGGQLTLIVMVILLVLSSLAERRSFRRTEVWLMLERNERPPIAVAQKLVGGALRDAYIYFANLAALLAAGELSGSVLLRIISVVPKD